MVLTSSLTAQIAALPALPLPGGTGGSGDQLGAANILLDPVRRGTLDPAARLALQQALSGAISTVIWLLAGIALLALLATWFFPRTRAQEEAPVEALGGESLG